MGPMVQFIKTNTGAKIPSYATDGSAGLDLSCVEHVQLNPGQRALVDTGLLIALSPGHEAQVRPRSGLAYKLGITVLNAPGTIDVDYRGALKVLLVNHGDSHVHFSPGDRIAQLVIAPVATAHCVEVKEFSGTTERGGSGFGSTGTS